MSVEKYKDIILKKKPKDNLEYSYTGNYEVGVQRCIEVEVPLFDYNQYYRNLPFIGIPKPEVYM